MLISPAVSVPGREAVRRSELHSRDRQRRDSSTKFGHCTVLHHLHVISAGGLDERAIDGAMASRSCRPCVESSLLQQAPACSSKLQAKAGERRKADSRPAPSCALLTCQQITLICPIAATRACEDDCARCQTNCSTVSQSNNSKFSQCLIMMMMAFGHSTLESRASTQRRKKWRYVRVQLSRRTRYNSCSHWISV